MRRVSVCGLLTSLVIGSVAGAQTPASQQVEWLYYGGDPGGTKYSRAHGYQCRQRPAARVAWQWKHWETPLEVDRRDSSRARRS